MVDRHTKNIHCASCKARLPVSLWAWTYDLGSSGPHSQSLCYAKLLKSGIQVWMLLHICFLAIQVMVFSIYVLFLYSADTSEYFFSRENFCTTEIPITFAPSLFVGFRIINPLKCRKQNSHYQTTPRNVKKQNSHRTASSGSQPSFEESLPAMGKGPKVFLIFLYWKVWKNVCDLLNLLYRTFISS